MHLNLVFYFVKYLQTKPIACIPKRRIHNSPMVGYTSPIPRWRIEKPIILLKYQNTQHEFRQF